MASRMGTLEIDCDAPPYDVVRSSEAVGLRSPLDVRWCHAGHFLNGAATGPGFLQALARRFLRAAEPPKTPSCTCGCELPALDRSYPRQRAPEPGASFSVSVAAAVPSSGNHCPLARMTNNGRRAATVRHEATSDSTNANTLPGRRSRKSDGNLPVAPARLRKSARVARQRPTGL